MKAQAEGQSRIAESRPNSANKRAFRLLFVAVFAVGIYGLGFAAGRQVARLVGRPVPSPAHAAVRNAPVSTTSQTVVTNRSPFLPDAATPLQYLEARVREIDRLGHYDEFFELDELAPLLFALSMDEYPLAWRLFRGLQSSDLREFFLGRLASIWAAKDPHAALEAVLTMPKTDEDQSALYNVLAAWAEQESAAAFAWARTQPEGKERDQAICWVLHGLAEHDPVAAAKLFLALPAGNAARGCGPDVIQSLAPSDPEGATAMLGRLDRSSRADALDAIAEARAIRNPQEALTWTQGLANVKERQAAMEVVVRSMSETQPEQALQFAMAQSDATLRDKLVTAVVRAWAAKDLAAASAWVAQLPAGPLREHAWRTPGSELHDEAVASQALALAPSEGLARTTELQRVGKIWSEHGENYQTVLEWAKPLPAGDRDALLVGVCASLGPDFPEEAVRIASSISSDKAQQHALVAAASVWSNTEPEAMAAWTATLPQGPARSDVLQQLAIAWPRSDPAAAAQWLCSLPADDARARAADACVSSLAVGRPDLAIQCLSLLTDETQCFQHIEDIARGWLRSDSEAAQAWLEETPLPAERKAKLLGR